MKPRLIRCSIHGPVFANPHFDLFEGGATAYRCPLCEKEALKAIKANPREVEIPDIPHSNTFRRKP